MNAKKIFIPLVLLVGLIVLMSSATFAQRAWYVDNSAIGNDGRDGSQPTIPVPDDGVRGPKKTLGGAPFGAIAASNAGDTIYVANTGVTYGTATGEPATITFGKKLIVRSTGGSVTISSLVEINNGAATPNNEVIFNSGAFTLNGGLTLTQGVLSNTADLLTVSGTITRSIAAATVAAQLKYTGTVDFVYAGAAAITAGNEFPASGTFRNLTTTGGGTNLTLKTSTAAMTGVITTTGAGTLNLGGNVLTITNTAAATHAVGGGNVTNGTLAFSMSGANVTVNGAVAIPTVTATTSEAVQRILVIAQPTSLTGTMTANAQAVIQGSVGALTTIGSASFTGDVITANNAGGVALQGPTARTINGNVVQNGTYTILANGNSTVNGNVLLASTGLNTTDNGQILFQTGPVTVNGNVTNNAGIVLGKDAAVTNAGLINFPAEVVTVTGTVRNAAAITGTALDGDNYTLDGVINFNSTTQLVTLGAVVNACTLSGTGIAASTVSTNGMITFQSTTGNIVVAGGFTNSSSMAKLSGSTNASNGIITTSSRTTGSIGILATRTGAVINSSVSEEPTNGSIDFRAAATGDFYGTSIQQGAVGAGGDIVLGDALINVSGNITSARTAAGADITVGGAATVTDVVSGYILNSGSSIISIDLAGNDIIGITGRVENTGSGQITFPNAGAGTITIGGLVVSAGTVSIPATSAAALSINGAVNITGGTASLLADASGVGIVITGPASFTGGTLNTTGRDGITTNSTAITFGGATTNTTMTPATPITLGNPSPTSLVTVTIGTFNPTIPGNLEVNNTAGLAEAVKFTGGSMTVVGDLLFTSGAIVLADNATISVQGNVTNNAGYTTPSVGRVSLAGTGAQTFGGTGLFGNIEFKNVGGTMATATPVTLAGTIYLTNGVVANTGAITINNSAVLPTVVLNAGSFSAAPTYVSNVNITYIGTDKATGNEIPADATKLQNLTVATTNGATAGKGIVTLSANTTVNGILTVNTLQALSIPNTFTLSMKGDSVVLNGDIINVGSGKLSLAKATGTRIYGTGYLPPVEIAAGSTGNVLSAKAIINELLGTDGVYAGAADFAPATGTASGSLTYLAGAANSATVILTGVTNGTMVGNVTTAGTGNTLTLGANLVVAGTLTHAAGTIDVQAFTLEQRGAAITLGSSTVPATFTGTGTLKFYQADNVTNSAFTLTSAAAPDGSIIGINTELNNADVTITEDDLILAGGPLTIAGALTITDGELVMNQNLTLTGSAATITTNGAVSGGSILRLNSAAPPLVFTYTGSPAISNLTISEDVTLAGTGTGLEVSTAFLHNGGDLAFGDMDLEITGTFTRTNDAGAYSAGAGYLILKNAAINQANGFSIPNLRFGEGSTIDFVFAGTGVVTVTKNLYIDNATANTITHTVSSAAKLAVADSVDVYYSDGKFDVAPLYAAGINLHVINAAARTIHATVWPATATLVRQLEIDNSAAANLPGARTVNNEILYTAGTLTLGAAAEDLTLVDASNINVIAGVLTIGAGSVTYGNANNVAYKINADYNADEELPTTVNNLTITRNTNGANSEVTITHSVTVNGELAIKNDLTIPAAPPTVAVTANGNVSIVNDVANFSNATNPVCDFNQSMVFGGANTTLTVPDLTPPLNIGTIAINKTANTNNLTLTGGDIETGFVTFVRGDIVTGDNVVYIPAPTQGTVAGDATLSQGFTGAGPNSMVVGNVAKALVNSGILNTSTEPSSIFPVGTGMVYRPMTLTFNPNFGVPTTPNATIVVGHVDSNPGGSQALPILDGIEAGVPIARYPSFYWSVYTVGSVSPSSKFDLGLTGGDFTDFDSPANVRIIRRHGAVGDLNNDWLLQGSNEQYDNEVNTETGFTAINRESMAGLRTGGAVFTYGLKTNIVATTFEEVTITKVGTAYPAYKLPLAGVFSQYVGSLTYTISSTNATIATAVVTNDTLVVTALKDGSATINILAMDENNDFAIAALPIKATSVGLDVVEIPNAFGLGQNYPNPFNPTTNISFDVPQNSSVKIVIYDMLGREVTTLVNTNYAPGRYTVPFNASRLSSGMYIYRMTSQSTSGETFTSVKKLMLVK